MMHPLAKNMIEELSLNSETFGNDGSALKNVLMKAAKDQDEGDASTVSDSDDADQPVTDYSTRYEQQDDQFDKG